MTVEHCKVKQTYMDISAMPLGGIDTILLCMEVLVEHCFLVFAIEHLSHQGDVSGNANYISSKSYEYLPCYVRNFWRTLYSVSAMSIGYFLMILGCSIISLWPNRLQ